MSSYYTRTRKATAFVEKMLNTLSPENKEMPIKNIVWQVKKRYGLSDKWTKKTVKEFCDVFDNYFLGSGKVSYEE